MPKVHKITINVTKLINIGRAIKNFDLGLIVTIFFNF